MNERIENLMVNASSGACYDGNDPVLSGAEIEKFAELIVRECMEMSTGQNQYKLGFQLAKEFKEHFGVE